MGHELDAIERTYDVIQWTLGRLESFPKVYRIPLGDRMQQTLYGILDVLIEAKYTRGRQKVAPLARANVLLERLRFQGRLACDRRCISQDQHGHFTRIVNDAGVGVGGWIKSQKRTNVAAGRSSSPSLARRAIQTSQACVTVLRGNPLAAHLLTLTRPRLDMDVALRDKYSPQGRRRRGPRGGASPC